MGRETSLLQTSLPLKRNYRALLRSSALIFVLNAAVSLFTLFKRHEVYETALLYSSMMPNDLVNLVIGGTLWAVVLMLLLSGRMLGLLLWPGALFFTLYQYVPYLVVLPKGPLTIVWGAIVLLSLFTLLVLLGSIEGSVIRERLGDRVRNRLAGWVLTLLALLILVRQGSQIGALLYNGSPLPVEEAGVWAADLIIAVPFLMVAGLSLFQRTLPGFLLGAGLLLAYALLAIAVMPLLYYQAHYNGTPVDWVGIAVVGVMAVVCVLPLGGFIRGAVKS